jgi:hypothetical protein
MNEFADIIRQPIEPPTDEEIDKVNGWSCCTRTVIKEVLTLFVHLRNAPPAPAVRDAAVEPSYGVALITTERQRQIAVEGWTPEHDDIHGSAALAKAAVCYALKSALPCFDGGHTPNMWPWADGWKPAPDPIRNLVKAGALIAAEIDRLQRAAIARVKGTKEESHA